MPFLAVVIISMMAFTSNANAGWLDIIKGIVGGVFGTAATPPVLPQNAQQQQAQQAQPAAPAKQSAAPAASPAPAPAPAQSAAPSEADIAAALDSLNAVCKKVSSKIPCAVGIGRGGTAGSALEDANEKSIVAIARSMNAFVKSNSKEIYKKIDDDDDFEESTSKERVTELTVEQEVKGSQTYLTYTRQVKKGNKMIYEVVEVRVLNANIFEKALAESSQGKPLGQQIIDESINGFVSQIKKSFGKR
jgi:predicted lipid-binding transport protein (Tim44 family)